MKTRWPRFKQAEFDIVYGEGFRHRKETTDMGVEHGFVRKAGAWYTYRGDQLARVRELCVNF